MTHDLFANPVSTFADHALEHDPKKLIDFFDQNMLQVFEFERFLFDQMIPSDREALWSMISKSCRLLGIMPGPRLARGAWFGAGRRLAAQPHHQRGKKVAFRFTRLIPVGKLSGKILDDARDFASRLNFVDHLTIVGRPAKEFGLEGNDCRSHRRSLCSFRA